MRQKYSLIGVDGNAYAILGYVSSAMKKEGYTKQQINEYEERAKGDSYENLICVSLEMIDELNNK